MSSLSERLKELFDYKGVRVSSIEKELDLSNDSIGKHIRNKSNVGSDIVIKIAGIYPDINLNWLLLGKGEMLNVQKKYEQEENLPLVLEEPETYHPADPWKLKFKEKQDENLSLLEERKDLKDRIMEQKKLIKMLEEKIESLEKQNNPGKASA